MGQQGVLSKRPRPNYGQASLEQQRPGAATPGWLSKSRAHSDANGAPAGGSSSPESHASSKENKVPAGRGRQVAQKAVAKADAATPAHQAGAGKATKAKSAPRSKSSDASKKHSKAAGTQRVAKASRKSAPARVNNTSRKQQAAKPAADSPAASDGSRDRRQSTRGRQAAPTLQVPTEPAEEAAGRKAVAQAQPAAKSSSGGKGRATRKRVLQEPAHSADKASKRQRTEPSRSRAAQEPAERPADASTPAVALKAAPAGAAAAAPQQRRRTSGRARAAASSAGPADPPAERPTQPAAPQAAEQPEAAAREAEGGGGGTSAHDTVASTPGSDLARRVDANISALQADYAKLQEAYRALKRQSVAHERGNPPAGPPAAAAAPPSENFLKLQVAHEELMGRYMELKAKKMEGLQEVLVAQAAQVEEHRAAAKKVAEHWKAEAARHEAAAAAAQAPQTQAELEALKAGRQRLTAQVLDLKAVVTERDARIAQLQHRLARAQLAAQTAEAACQAAEPAAAEAQLAANIQQDQQEAVAVVEQVGQELELATGPDALAATTAIGGEQQPAVAAEATGAAPAVTAMDATKNSGEGSAQRAASPAGSVQRPQHPQPTPFHLKEARAMVPEGLSLSDSYNQPSASTSQPSGRVLMRSEQRALVPYHNGASHERGGSGSGGSNPVDGSQVSVRTPAPGEADDGLSTMPGIPPPDIAAPPTNASLPVRQLQFASAARCAARPAAGAALEARNAITAAPPGGLGGPLHTLLGIQSSPFKNGGFLFEHRPSGYTFRLAPQADDAPAAAPEAGELWYKPYTLGELYDELPQFLREELTISTDQRPKLLNYILEALARHSGADSL